MNPKIIAEKIRAGREFMKGAWSEGGFVSDQQLRKPQPPLVKAPMGGERLPLPGDFRALPLQTDLLELLRRRKSSRVYTRAPVTLRELSFLLWAQQGVRGIRGDHYATLRTVACGGARHPFECYLAVLNVEGLREGLYHYLPLTHELERLAEPGPLADRVGDALAGQDWCGRSACVFFYSMSAYRGEWRYGPNAHRVALIDSGHVTANLYVACAALRLGTCAIAALDTAACDSLFGLDGEEEFIFYAATLGRISDQDAEKEDAFYAFLKEGE